jgi:hypothetical protein
LDSFVAKPAPAPAISRPVTEDQVKNAVRGVLAGKDVNTSRITVVAGAICDDLVMQIRQVREQILKKLSCDSTEIKKHKGMIKAFVRQLIGIEAVVVEAAVVVDADVEEAAMEEPRSKYARKARNQRVINSVSPKLTSVSPMASAIKRKVVVLDVDDWEEEPRSKYARKARNQRVINSVSPVLNSVSPKKARNQRVINSVSPVLNSVSPMASSIKRKVVVLSSDTDAGTPSPSIKRARRTSFIDRDLEGTESDEDSDVEDSDAEDSFLDESEGYDCECNDFDEQSNASALLARQRMV